MLRFKSYRNKNTLANSGHLAVTSRFDVSDFVIQELTPLVMEEEGFVTNCPGMYVDICRLIVNGKPQKGLALFTISDGPNMKGQATVPWIIGVGCWEESQSNAGWEEVCRLADLYIGSFLKMESSLPAKPLEAPWLGVILVPSLSSNFLEYLHLLGDFERCLFWTMVEAENRGTK